MDKQKTIICWVCGFLAKGEINIIAKKLEDSCPNCGEYNWREE